MVESFESCYRAASSRDARFDGRFIVAVRTTGIYCRPSCPASVTALAGRWRPWRAYATQHLWASLEETDEKGETA